MFGIFGWLFRSRAPIPPARHTAPVTLRHGEDHAPEQLYQMWKRIYPDHHIAWWLASHHLVPREHDTPRSPRTLRPGSSTDVYQGKLSAPESELSFRGATRKRGASWFTW
jgi:hypothetical protein